MKLTISHLRQIIQEELKEGLAGATAAHMNTYPEDKKQAQIRNKADEMVDFGKWEKQFLNISCIIYRSRQTIH